MPTNYSSCYNENRKRNITVIWTNLKTQFTCSLQWKKSFLMQPILLQLQVIMNNDTGRFKIVHQIVQSEKSSVYINKML